MHEKAYYENPIECYNANECSANIDAYNVCVCVCVDGYTCIELQALFGCMYLRCMFNLFSLVFFFIYNFFLFSFFAKCAIITSYIVQFVKNGRCKPKGPKK